MFDIQFQADNAAAALLLGKTTHRCMMYML